MRPKEEHYVCENAELATDSEILSGLGYNKEKYYVVERREGYSGGGGDESLFVIIKPKTQQQSPSSGFDEDGWPIDDTEDDYEEDTTGNTTDV